MTAKSSCVTGFGLCALRGLAATLLLTLTPLGAIPAETDTRLFEQPLQGMPKLTGKWAMPSPIKHLLTTQGKDPPLNATGRAEYASRQAALKAGDSKIDPIASCLMHGTPRLLYAPYPFLILETARSVNFVHEANHTFRIIYWDKTPPEEPDPTYLGSSIARFEGKTLVIDTIGFNDKTWLDYSGLPHGEKLKVEERYALADPNTIEGRVIITDPDYYTSSWSSNFTLKKQPGMELKESVCTDTHRM